MSVKCSPISPHSAESFNQRLLAYSAAAGAALALAPAASAQITNIVSTAAVSMPGNNDSLTSSFSAGRASFVLFGRRVSGTSSRNSFHYQRGYAGVAQADSRGKLATRIRSVYPLLNQFAHSAQIKSFGRFGSRGRAFGGYSSKVDGDFAPAGSHTPAVGYVGLKEVVNGHNYYGWLRIEVTKNASDIADGISLDPVNGITGAYNATPDGSIKAGEIASIPEPAHVAAGLSLLALGAGGVREMRRRRKKLVV